MLVCASASEGMPARLYRAPCEIQRDMSKISRELRDIEEMLSVRNIVLEMVTECAGATPEKWIPELEELLCEARDALSRMHRLRDSLEDLSDELEVAKCYAS